MKASLRRCAYSPVGGRHLWPGTAGFTVCVRHNRAGAVFPRQKA